MQVQRLQRLWCKYYIGQQSASYYYTKHHNTEEVQVSEVFIKV